MGERRLDGLGAIGYCAGAGRWFCGVREHLVYTPHGLIATLTQLSGNRHDSKALYALLETSFRGVLLGDNAYTPHKKLRGELHERGIRVVWQTRDDARESLPSRTKVFVKSSRFRVERFIALFCRQFSGGKTACRNARHYLARRWMKALTHNLSRYLSPKLDRPAQSVQHFNLSA